MVFALALSRLKPVLVCSQHTHGEIVNLLSASPNRCVLGETDRSLRQALRLTLFVERSPRLIAHHVEYREADESDFALQGRSGMKFEVRGTRAIIT
jgi:hypothetical protein